eukprot:TRINITY_DN5785_c0_g1_i2.p1 TRINITY_DN5785_c0_g1~~TRINITY_DN5785_c0_g1_i2.p1  ORF type:complete len:576 (+),score=133.39 TRINITY_DN5785_c0_g1_i2:48-1730(+)
MSSSSDSSASGSKQETNKKKDKSNGKAKKLSKKEAKKAKKEAKKAKKLAKQIKKLEDQVNKRKRQIAGEVVKAKKKKKKSSSSSSNSAEPAKKAKKQGESKAVPQPEDLQEVAAFAGADVKERSRSRSRSMERPCPGCSQELQWSNSSEGDYAKDWLCDNVEFCGSSGRVRGTRWRWNCPRCMSDYCGDCVGRPEGWQPPEDDGYQRSESRSRSPPSPTSSEDSDPEVHEGVVCDHCDMKPIKGPRFKCNNCEDVSLCKKCYKRRQLIHNKHHKFFAMKVIAPKPEIRIEAAKEETHPQVLQESPSREERLAEEREPPPELPAEPLPVVMPTPELAQHLQERWQNIGKEYMKTQPKIPEAATPVPAAKASAKKSAGNVASTAAAAPAGAGESRPAEQKPKRLPGKRMAQGSECMLCHQQVPDNISGVICVYLRPDGTDGGCNKGYCFECMKRASSRLFGNVRTNKEVWKSLRSRAWWMHERCMTGDDQTQYHRMIKESQARRDALSVPLPEGWEAKQSNSTGKIYYVNEKLGKTQWTPPGREFFGWLTSVAVVAVSCRAQ